MAIPLTNGDTQSRAANYLAIRGAGVLEDRPQPECSLETTVSARRTESADLQLVSPGLFFMSRHGD